MSVLMIGVLSVLMIWALGLLLRPWLVRILPDDLAGPDGWLIDTETGTGIFDLHYRRRLLQ